MRRAPWRVGISSGTFALALAATPTWAGDGPYPAPQTPSASPQSAGAGQRPGYGSGQAGGTGSPLGEPMPGYPTLPGTGPAGEGAGGMAPGAGGMTPGAGTAAPGAGADASGLGGAGAGAGTGPGFPAPAPTSGLGLDQSSALSDVPMIGDMSPPMALRKISQNLHASQTTNRPPPPPSRFSRSLLAPSVRGYKIAENQSPIPQDRVFFNFSFYDDANKHLNNVFETPIAGVQIYRYVWGFEKTFNQGLGSIGLSLPLNTVSAKSREASLNSGGSSTSLGNLSVYLKHVFYIDPASGSVFTGGIAITPETGPKSFAGAPFLGTSNTTTIQPYFAYLLNFDRFYINGFNSIDVPYDFNQPTMLYNDVGLGYFLYRDTAANGIIRSIVPTVEAHANIPLNHRGEYNLLDRFGTPDIVNITSGVHIGLYQRSTLTFAFITPVTGPRPFDFEPQLLLNVYFGKTRRSGNLQPPMIGG